MIVTAAFFCDAANASTDNKLNVVGGVWDSYSIAPEGAEIAYPLTLVSLVEVTTGDTMPASLKVEVRSPDGTTMLTTDGQVSLPSESIHGFVISNLRVPFTALGRHVFEIGTTSGTPIVVGLDIRR